MLKIGITGINGLLGTHLRAYLHTLKDVEVFGADRTTFSSEKHLADFVSSCDVIVHLAGMNRGADTEVVETNIRLADQLVKALTAAQKTPHLIFSSSTQIDKGTLYGDSKIACSLRFMSWAKEQDALFTNLILPNIFGEGGKPFYNSVVSTFCHQLAHKQQPVIKVDADIEFLHAGELACRIHAVIQKKEGGDIRLTGRSIKVSDLLNKLCGFSQVYEGQIIPDVKDKFDRQLFNTYRAYLYPQFYPVVLALKKDDRGEVFETVKTLGAGQCFISTTKPGITRGEHFHLNKLERFLVVKGEAKIRVRQLFSADVKVFDVSGVRPCFIDIPTMHTHNITNIGQDELVTLFWSGEIFDPGMPDTFMEKVEA